jgi:hypothetical protein
LPDWGIEQLVVFFADLAKIRSAQASADLLEQRKAEHPQQGPSKEQIKAAADRAEARSRAALDKRPGS